MLKELLIAESQNIDTHVELDSVFESVELSPEVKANFSTVFEAAVKNGAFKLAESHIQKIATLADEKLAESVEASTSKVEAALTESMGKFLDHIAKDWMAENALAVDKGIKADLFESVMLGMKELFVEHNVVVPEESVDVVAEMEEELAEQKEETARLFEEVTKRDAYINYVQREVAVNEATKDLTESQKEKVGSLVEGMDYSDAFSGKLGAIVEMVKGSITESGSKETITEGVINNTEDDAAGLNFVTEAVEEVKPVVTKEDSIMDSYVSAATRIS